MGDTQTTSTGSELKQKLAQQLKAARGRLDALQSDIESDKEADAKMLRQRRDQLNQRIEQQKDRAREMQANINKWKDEKVAHTQDAVASWRQRHDLKKLESRADRATDYALDMVSVATYDFEVAEQAVLDALEARLDADAAASTSTASTPTSSS
jgi:uncharacterized coiled-coil DUF342 family protein